MGYRLEISKLVLSDCGGKLYGYIDPKDLFQCKSYQWLKQYYLGDDVDEFSWGGGFSPQIVMDVDNYREFIKLYIEDYNKFSLYGNKLSLNDFKDSLSSDYFVLVDWF